MHKQYILLIVTIEYKINDEKTINYKNISSIKKVLSL